MSEPVIRYRVWYKDADGWYEVTPIDSNDPPKRSGAMRVRMTNQIGQPFFVMIDNDYISYRDITGKARKPLEDHWYNCRPL